VSIAIKKTCEIIEKLRETPSKPWLEIQHEVEAAAIKQGSFEPLYVGCEGSPNRLRFVPQKQPQIISRKFDEELNRIGKVHSLVVQMRCTGYNLFKDTREPEGLDQKIRRALGMAYRTRLLRVLYLDKYGIELQHPELPDMPEALEEIGKQLYEMVE
jgi:hypothetical protein